MTRLNALRESSQCCGCLPDFDESVLLKMKRNGFFVSSY